MIHLITVSGESARKFHLEQRRISDFKALLRTICSGRTLFVSTRFRSDLFYNASEVRTREILTLWSMYGNFLPMDYRVEDLTTSIGANDVLTWYFQSINTLSNNWFKYRKYRESFLNSFANDPQNDVARMVLGCDQQLVEHPNIRRSALVDNPEKISPKLPQDTFSLAMGIIQRDEHEN